MPPSGTTVVRSKPNQRWTPAEESALRRGIAKHGAGKWQQIISDPDLSIGALLARRSNVDLKDKWRNMRPKACKAGSAALKRGWSPSGSSPLPFEEDLAAPKRMRRDGLANGVATPGDAAVWAAALDFCNPIVQADSGLFAQCLAAAQQQGASAPAAFQAVASYAELLSAAHEKQQAQLLASMRKGDKAMPCNVRPHRSPAAQQCHQAPSPVPQASKHRPGPTAVLWEACASLDIAAAAAALSAGADLCSAGPDGRTALHALAASGSHGNSGATAAGHLVGMLLQNGAQIDAPDAAGVTPLHLAHDAPMAAVLLAAGAPVNAVNNAGETPLFAAAAANAETVVRVLLQQGAVVDHQDDCGETALIRAAGREDAQEAALRLLEAGASVHIVDGAGRTALHAAAEAGSDALVAALLARGAAPGTPDAAGDSPLALASRNCHSHVVPHLCAAMGSASAAIKGETRREQT